MADKEKDKKKVTPVAKKAAFLRIVARELDVEPQ